MYASPISKLMALAIRFEQIVWDGEVGRLRGAGPAEDVTRAWMHADHEPAQPGTGHPGVGPWRRKSTLPRSGVETADPDVVTGQRPFVRAASQPPKMGHVPISSGGCHSQERRAVREVIDLLPQCVPSQPCSRFACTQPISEFREAFAGSCGHDPGRSESP